MTNTMPPLPPAHEQEMLDSGLTRSLFTGAQMHDYARLAIKQHMARLGPLVMEAADCYAAARWDVGYLRQGKVSKSSESARAALAKLLEIEQ
jgi:hypothetical protein